MFKKYPLLILVIVCLAVSACSAQECSSATCTPCAGTAPCDQADVCKKAVACETQSDACSSCTRTAEMPEQEAALTPCKSQIDLEAMFPVESWKKFCQALSAEEQSELRRMTEAVNCAFNKLSEELGGTLKVHKQLMEKYKKHKGITTCCYSLAFNLVPQEKIAQAEPSAAPANSDTTKPEFAKSLNPEEQTEFDGLQVKLQEIGRRTSAQVIEIFESNKPLKAKLYEFCKSTKQSLLLTMSCDHPELSETIKIVN